MAEKYINIHFPFEDDDRKNYFLKMNQVSEDAIKSDLIHLLLTNKGERLYLPEFGANLRQYLFEPNDTEVRNDIKDEVQQAVQKFMPNLQITKVTVEPPEEGSREIVEHSAVVNIEYVVTDGAFQKSDLVSLKL